MFRMNMYTPMIPSNAFASMSKVNSLALANCNHGWIFVLIEFGLGHCDFLRAYANWMDRCSVSYSQLSGMHRVSDKFIEIILSGLFDNGIRTVDCFLHSTYCVVVRPLVFCSV